MSDVFTVWCHTEDIPGPVLQRTEDATELIDTDAWSAFLIEHVHHEIVLFHGSLAKVTGA